MRVLVTGATGFIGSFLVEKLLAAGHEVRALLRRTSATHFLPVHRIEAVIGTLQDAASLQPAVAGCDVVFHLAGATRALSMAEFETINAGGTRNLLAACEQANPALQRFLLVSSLAAAGPSRNRDAVREEDAPAPVSNYGRSKWHAEKITRDYAEKFPITIVRPPVVYGPRDRDVLVLFQQIQRRLAPQLGGAARRFSLIHVYDLVRGILLAASSEAAVGETFFLTNPAPVTWRDFAAAIEAATGKKAWHVKVPRLTAFPVAAMAEMYARLSRRPALLSFDKVREMREPCWTCSPEKAYRMLGFEARLSLEIGVQATAKWYMENGWL